VDTFLPAEQAFLGKDPQASLQKGDFTKMRVITGVAESEGAGMLSTKAIYSIKMRVLLCLLTKSRFITINFRRDPQSWSKVVRRFGPLFLNSLDSKSSGIPVSFFS